jgi:hypothetical protein
MRHGETGGWRKVRNEELHNFYSSPNRMIKSRRMKWSWHVAVGEEFIRSFGMIPEGEIPLKKHRRRWESNILK